MGRSSRAPALAAALVLVALFGPAAAVSSVFTATGKSFVVSTPEWTLMSPFSDAGGGTGVFYNATSIFTFTAPKNKGPKSKDGTTVKRATTMKFNKITLTPVTVTPTGLQTIPGAVGPVLSLRVKLQKGSLVPQTSNVSFAPQGTAFPYSVLYGGPSQVNPTLLTPNTGAKILGKPQLKYGKSKPIKISTSSPTFQLTVAGVASAVCADGYGGAIGTAASGCAQCKAGSYASKFDQSQPCKLCSSVSSNSISAQAGASSCTNCPAGTTPNANGTACIGGTTPVTSTYLLTATGPCNATTANQIKNSVEAYVKGQTGVQSATATVTCTEFLTRRRQLLGGTNSLYTVVVSCEGTTCTGVLVSLDAVEKSCCPSATQPPPTVCSVAPPTCVSTTPGTTSCAKDQYIKNGACVACGPDGTSPGGTVPGCSCKQSPTIAKYNTTTDTCFCPTGSYNSATGCSTGACQADEYFDSDAKICKKCTKGCASCSGPYTCLVCKAGDDSSLIKIANGYADNVADLWLAPDATTGYWLNSVTGTCDTCIAKCKECVDGTTCKTCFYGTYLKEGVYCEDCPGDCAECTSTGCTKCKPGYWLNAGVCTACEAAAGGSAGCADCGTDGKTCKTCKVGYGFLATVGKCDLCGAFSTPPDGSQYCTYGACSTLQTTCTSCTPVNAKAKTAGYYLSGSSTCVACTNLGTNGVAPAGAGFCAKCSQNPNLCEQCAEGSYRTADLDCVLCTDLNCAQCSDGATCNVCKDGFYRDSSGACVACTGGLNCKTCSDANTCTTCADTYFLKDKKCGACAVPNAIACSSASVATKCADEYFLTKSGLACVKCGANCKVCANNNDAAGKCAKCNGGFTIDPNNPTQCV